ncbi:hypothetical protein INR49_008444 [Caranx melampygus]|nr:hypothetical protein INR49_008444 [Caranx melampygus]
MKKKLEQGTTLVVDRYAFSGAAFTSAKPGFCLDWCKHPDMGLPKPDLVMFLQLNPDQAALRGQFGGERYETSDFQKAVKQKFDQLMKDPSVNWQVIDASQSIEDVHRAVIDHTFNTINTAQCTPLGELWKERISNSSSSESKNRSNRQPMLRIRPAYAGTVQPGMDVVPAQCFGLGYQLLVGGRAVKHFSRKHRGAAQHLHAPVIRHGSALLTSPPPAPHTAATAPPARVLRFLL